MSLKEQLATDLKEAMKAKDIVRKNAVQMIRAAVLQVEKDQKVELSDAGVTEVIARQLKQRQASLPDYEKSGRDDLIDELKREIEILLSYLPKQLSEAEIEEIVVRVIAETGASSPRDIGKVMPKVREITKASADGKLVSEIVKKHLSQG